MKTKWHLEVHCRERESSAQKHFKKKFPELGESTVRSFKQKYLASGKSSVISIPTKCKGTPLMLGDFNHEVQKYIKALHYIPLIIMFVKDIYHGHYKMQK